MRYIITESQMDKIVFMYLNDIKWDIFESHTNNLTRLFFKGDYEQVNKNDDDYYWDIIFEAYDDDESEDRVLSVNPKFFSLITRLFNLSTTDGRNVLLKWYNKFTGENCTDIYVDES